VDPVDHEGHSYDDSDVHKEFHVINSFLMGDHNMAQKSDPNSNPHPYSADNYHPYCNESSLQEKIQTMPARQSNYFLLLHPGLEVDQVEVKLLIPTIQNTVR